MVTRFPAVADCCKAWDDLPAERRAKWGWQVLHTWAHSRVPFTVDRLADTGRISIDQAAKAVEIARQRKWLFRAGGGASTPDDHLYVGRLAPRRH